RPARGGAGLRQRVLRASLVRAAARRGLRARALHELRPRRVDPPPRALGRLVAARVALRSGARRPRARPAAPLRARRPAARLGPALGEHPDAVSVERREPSAGGSRSAMRTARPPARALGRAALLSVRSSRTRRPRRRPGSSRSARGTAAGGTPPP